MWYLGIVFAYREVVGISPAQSVKGLRRRLSGLPGPIDGLLLEELWQECDGANCGLERGEFNRFWLMWERPELWPGGWYECFPEQQAAYFRDRRLGDLVLARACAAGNERAWERFVAIYRHPLVRAAIAITGSDTLGRELADQLYAELFGLTTRDGERRCPLQSYADGGR